MKEHSPEDLGRVLGLDRAPEVKTLRRKLSRLATVGRATEFGRALAERRVAERGAALGFLYVIVVLDLERLAIDRGEFIERLRHRGIGASVHFIPLHLHPFYRDRLGYRPEDFPNATWLAERNVSLPCYSRMTEGDVQRVVGAVGSIVEACRR